MAEVNQTRPRQKRTDVLYCLTLEDKGSVREFYKDQPWEGIRAGLLDANPEDDPGEDCVLIYTVAADGETAKQGNTQSTWRTNPVSFDVRRDAEIRLTHRPKLTLCSKALVDLMEQLMDYYSAHIGSKGQYEASMEGIIVEMMYFYQELKTYFLHCASSLPAVDASPELDIRNCGDEKYTHLVEQELQFGSLEIEKDRCDKDGVRDLAVLLRTLAPMYRLHMAPTLSSMYLDEEPRIKYEALWVLLRPGTYVYVQSSAFRDTFRNLKRSGERAPGEVLPDDPPDDNERVACIISSWEYEEKSGSDRVTLEESVDRLYVYLWYIQHDGHTLQRIARSAVICRFHGFRLVNGLEVVPAGFHDRNDKGTLRRRFKRRGKRYMSILAEKVAHREYNDPAGGPPVQIIVDPRAYASYAHKTNHPMMPRYKQQDAPMPIVDGDGGRRFQGFVDFQAHNSDVFPRIEEVYILCPRRIPGLVLKNKAWMYFEIDCITDTSPKYVPDQLKDELVLVSDEDRHVLRTVLPKGEKPVGISPDFIPGKGEGKIFLLYGPPGTGKTLTVECVANDTRRPLITLTAQDIKSSYPGSSDYELAKWFTVAAKWDAILLVDEADLFLEQRRSGDTYRNELATVFLRTLEYYKGVLFLTTNRPGHIDDSFISRITSPIAFKPLTREAKAQIVRKFVRKFEETGTIEVEKSASTYLIDNSEKLNGREIRNLLQNAVAAAEVQQKDMQRVSAQMTHEETNSDIVSVRLRHVKTVIERQTEFRLYMETLKGGRDEPARAKSRQDYLSTA